VSTSQHSIDGDARTPGLPAGQELFALLGERWNNVILRQVFFGVQRFGALQRALGIAPSTLTARLADLVAAGLLKRHRMGHEVPGMRGVCSHIAPEWRADLTDGLQRLWEESLAERARLSPYSAVPLLNDLLADYRTGGV
jgi:hypothetical protein